jgi:hypothetical protein
MGGDKLVVLLERLKALAGVQGAVEIRALELLKEPGAVPNHGRQLGALQDFEPFLGMAGKGQPTHTMLGLLAERFHCVTGVNQRSSLNQCFDGIDQAWLVRLCKRSQRRRRAAWRAVPCAPSSDCGPAAGKGLPALPFAAAFFAMWRVCAGNPAASIRLHHSVCGFMD